jgi:hypothetical protein
MRYLENFQKPVIFPRESVLTTAMEKISSLEKE